MSDTIEAGLNIGPGDRRVSILAEKDQNNRQDDRNADCKQCRQGAIHAADDRLLLGNRVATATSCRRRVAVATAVAQRRAESIIGG